MLAEIMLEYVHSIFFGREEFAAMYGSSVLFDKLNNVAHAKGKRLEGILRDYCSTIEGGGEPLATDGRGYLPHWPMR